MVKEVFVEFALSLALDDYHLKYWEGVDPKLEEEVDFEFGPFECWPVGVVLVDFGAFAAPAYNRGEPVLFPEEDVGDNCGEGIETSVIAEF